MFSTENWGKGENTRFIWRHLQKEMIWNWKSVKNTTHIQKYLSVLSSSHHNIHISQSELCVIAPPVDWTHVLQPSKGRHGDGSSNREDGETVCESSIHPFLGETKNLSWISQTGDEIRHKGNFTVLYLSSEVHRFNSSIDGHKTAGQESLEEVKVMKTST